MQNEWRSDYALKLVNLCMAAVALAMIACLIWSVNRGFDVLDEGFYLLLYANPSEYIFTSSWYHIVSKLPKLCSPDLCNYRVLGLILRLLGAIIIATGTCVWLKHRIPTLNRQFFITISAVAVIANLVSYAVLPQTLSYNGMGAFLLFSATGFLLLAAADKDGKTIAPMRALSLVLAGFCIGGCLFVKITSALAFMVTVPMLFVRNTNRWYLRLALVLIGVSGAILLYFASCDTVSSWVERNREILTNEFQDNNHLRATLIIHWFIDTIKIAARAGLVFGPLTLAALFFWRRKVVFGAICLVLVPASLYYAARSSYFVRADTFYVLGAVAIAAMIVQLLRNAEMKKWRVEYLGMLLFLALLPFCASVGTNNPIYWHMASNICPWSMMTIGCSLAWSKRSNIVLVSSAALTLVFSTWIFIYGFVLHPYRLPSAIFEQKLPLDANTTLPGVLVDLPTKQVVEQVKSCLSHGGFLDGDPILAFYDMPGLVYAVGGRSVGVGWFRPQAPHLNQAALQRLKNEDTTRLFLLVSTTYLPMLNGSDGFQSKKDLAEPTYTCLGVVHGLGGRWPDLSTVAVYQVRQNPQPELDDKSKEEKP